MLDRIDLNLGSVPSTFSFFNFFLFSRWGSDMSAATLTHDEKMKLIQAFEMMEEWLNHAGHDWTTEEQAKYLEALRVIGPID